MFNHAIRGPPDKGRSAGGVGGSMLVLPTPPAATSCSCRRERLTTPPWGVLRSSVTPRRATLDQGKVLRPVPGLGRCFLSVMGRAGRPGGSRIDPHTPPVFDGGVARLSAARLNFCLMRTYPPCGHLSRVSSDSWRTGADSSEDQARSASAASSSQAS